MLFKKEQPMVPKIIIPTVDVRDVAKMHVSALKTDKSIGKRFLLSENTYWMKDISQCLKDLGYNAPTIQAPDFLIKLMAKFDKSLVAALPHLGFRFSLNTSQAKDILGFNPIPLKDTCKDTRYRTKCTEEVLRKIRDLFRNTCTGLLPSPAPLPNPGDMLNSAATSRRLIVRRNLRAAMRLAAFMRVMRGANWSTLKDACQSGTHY